MENAIKWKADFQRESIIKVSFIKITVISMLNFASSNVVICYQYHIHNAKVVTMIAMTNNMLNTTPIISNPLIMIARHNIKLIFFFIYANIMQKHKVMFG